MNGDYLATTRPVYIARDHCGYCSSTKKDPYGLDSWSDAAITPAEAKKVQKFDAGNNSITIGLDVQAMSPSVYDKLMNTGFRRSGTFLYKPDLLRGCCRLYTIRTNLKALKLSKQHRQTVNRFVRAISEPDGAASSSAGGKKGKDKPRNSSSSFSSESPLLANLVAAEASAPIETFYTRFGPSKYTDEKFQLYKKYQMRVHGDEESEITAGSFERFLCEHPFETQAADADQKTWDYLNSWKTPGNTTEASTPPPRRIGPTHECYYYKGKLIAISVLDFLPSGVSSIYFIWDPDYPQFSLGTLSGLREIYMCQRLNLGYYYLGYYVDDCDKMRYKRKFGGEVLDVVNMVFLPFDRIGDMIAGDKLFTAGAAKPNFIGNYANMTEPVPSLGPDGYPGDAGNVVPEEDSIANYAPTLYSPKSSIYTIAESKERELVDKYGVEDTTRGNALFNFPHVVPGLFPVGFYDDSFTVEDLLPEKFHIIKHGMVHQLKPFVELTSREKRVVVDTTRVVGLDIALNTFIII